MANVLVNEASLEDIADAIRAKNGTQNKYKPAQMADAISAISGGGITPTGTINITANGTHDVTNYASANVAVPTGTTPTGTTNITQNGTHDVTNYASANVNVPNSYSASDEGKVVSNGALVAQTSQTVTENGTYDTTLDCEIVVEVASGGGEDTFLSYLKGTLNGVVSSDETFSIGNYACYRNTAQITEIRFPNVTTVGNSAFYMANITSAFVPNAVVDASAFYGALLQTVVSGAARYTSSSACFRKYAGATLRVADLTKKGAGLTNQMFQGQTNFETLILRASEIYPLVSTGAFNETPFASGGTGGTIYIPKALYDHLGDGSAYDYKSTTNWSTYDGYGTITWAQIEGSIYETQYADGTLIV